MVAIVFMDERSLFHVQLTFAAPVQTCSHATSEIDPNLLWQGNSTE